MKISSITLSASRTINTGNYNSLKVEGSATVELADGEDTPMQLEIARSRAIGEIKTQMQEAYNEVKAK